MAYQYSTHLINEWHKKNEKALISFARSSHFRAWWKCSKCFHEWQTAIGNRTRENGSGCPICVRANLRGNKNPQWNGYGEISGRQWHCIKHEATQERRNRRSKSHIALPFKITIEYAWNLFIDQNRKCRFTGKELIMWGKKKGKEAGTASLDRIDSSLGYLEGNVQWIEKKLQHLKRNLSDSEFIEICENVASHQAAAKRKFKMPPSFSEWKLE